MPEKGRSRSTKVANKETGGKGASGSRARERDLGGVCCGGDWVGLFVFFCGGGGGTGGTLESKGGGRFSVF